MPGIRPVASDGSMSNAPARMGDFLIEYGLARPGETSHWFAMTGGVSSEIWRVDLPGRSICVKRALPRLKVLASWEAPISRNAYEWRWLCFAAANCPQCVPRPLAHDERAGLFAMSFLDPDEFPVWKGQLLAGTADSKFSSMLGSVLARLHNASARRADLAYQFDSLDNFMALRIEPYLLETAKRHPDLKGTLEGIAERTVSEAKALVHGDVSPKNILVGREGPVLLDAECAWYGDPAFDAAFCLNHLLLKSLIRFDCGESLMKSYVELANSYLGAVAFEDRAVLESRVAELLPALLLSRVDGKSPVEYLTSKEREKDLLRHVACSLLRTPVRSVSTVADIWFGKVASLYSLRAY